MLACMTSCMMRQMHLDLLILYVSIALARLYAASGGRREPQVAKTCPFIDWTGGVTARKTGDT